MGACARPCREQVAEDSHGDGYDFEVAKLGVQKRVCQTWDRVCERVVRCSVRCEFYRARLAVEVIE